MKIEIVTPKGRIFVNEEVEYITVPTSDGVITIKDDHIPILSLLVPGGVEIKLEGEKEEKLVAVSRGILEIRRNSAVNILADTAEHAEEIDLERAEVARLKAEEFLKKKDYTDDIEFAMLQAKIEKEMARIHVANKYRK